MPLVGHTRFPADEAEQFTPVKAVSLRGQLALKHEFTAEMTVVNHGIFPAFIDGRGVHGDRSRTKTQRVEWAANK